jgi:Methyltransferase domain
MSTLSGTLRGLADGHSADSFSNRMRGKRFERFEALTATLDRPLRILDIGGTHNFWAQRGWAGRDDVDITMVNLHEEPTGHANLHSMVGDATNLSGIGDGEYDVAFSNSVIEHLFTGEAQAAMAREVQRVAKAYWVQTPNFWFPMEPHFLVPGWHYMPERMRVAIIQRRQCGWRGPCPDIDQARAIVREVRLMRKRELVKLFPDATLYEERFYGLTKSFVVHQGFPAI